MPHKGNVCLDCGKPCCYGCQWCKPCSGKHRYISKETLAATAKKISEKVTKKGPWLSKDWLYQEYITKNRSAKDISSEFDISVHPIYRALKKHGIKKHPSAYSDKRAATVRNNVKEVWQRPEYIDKMTNGRKGEKNPNYRGGKWKVEDSFLRKIRRSGKYMAWKDAVLRRDVITYPKIPKNLQVHHIKSLSRLVRENNIKTFEEAMACGALWDIKNGLVLTSAEHLIITWMNRMKRPSVGFVDYVEEFINQDHEIHEWCS